MEPTLKDTLKKARKLERKFPSKENTLRVRKLIYRAMCDSFNPERENYKIKYNL